MKKTMKKTVKTTTKSAGRQPVLTERELSVLREARKILKRITAKSDAWEKRIDKFASSSSTCDRVWEEEEKHCKWQDRLQKAAHVRFDAHEAVIDLGMA